jgi:mannose-1-phosphate guanylyltransferase
VFNQTRGILLAGTHPWSSAAFDSLVPRALLPVAHRPLIWYGLSWLHREGIRDVAVCGNRETRLLQSRLARYVPLGLMVSYHEDPMPRGAAGSARDAALATEAQTFVVADGTSIPNVNLGDLLLKHHTSGACVTVVVHSEARRNGNPDLNVPSGIYVFTRRAFDEVPAHGFCDIKEKLIPQLYGAGERIVAYETATATPRVLDAATYSAVNEWMVEHLVRNGADQEGYVKSTHGLVHRDAFIAGDATMVGPVLVGPGARVLSGAVVVGPTSIGREVTIARGAMVSRSAVWRRASIGERAIADRCIVSDDAVIEAGTQTFQGVVVADPRSCSDSDWVVRQGLQEPKKRALEGGARLGRLVFGASWSRSPAGQ